MAIVNKVAVIVSTIGSVFAQKATDGKVEVAVGPICVVAVGGLLLGCAYQVAEPFSQCVVTVGQYIFGG